MCQNLALTVLYVPESDLDCLIRAKVLPRLSYKCHLDCLIYGCEAHLAELLAAALDCDRDRRGIFFTQIQHSVHYAQIQHSGRLEDQGLVTSCPPPLSLSLSILSFSPLSLSLPRTPTP